MRAFIAIDLEDHIREQIRTLLLKLRRTPASVRWVGPERMHLTLKFLGEVSSDRIEKIRAAMEETASLSSSFSLQVEGTGRFPPRSRSPRVVWIGISPVPELLDLQQQLEEALSGIGFPPEKRRFFPHLTLGRVRSSQQLTTLLELLDKHQRMRFGTLSVKALILFESRLLPQGAEYHPVYKVELF